MGLKRIMPAISCFLLIAGTLNAAETVKLITDKSVYLAGELVWCSAVCENVAEGDRPSATAYVELVSAEGIAAEAKIALISGFGSGVLSLPSGIPTGNYKLFAFTALSDRAEVRDITIFNTISGARVKGGVTICSDPAEKPAPLVELPEGIEIRTILSGDRMAMIFRNTSSRSQTVCISVVEDDGLRSSSSVPQSVRLEAGEAETDGEIVRATIHGKDSAKVASMPWLIPVISSPGSAADTYTGVFREGGIITFRTNNIYGKRDLVCEFFGFTGKAPDCSFSPISPFVFPEGLDFKPLRLSESMRDALTARNSALSAPVQADTLYNFLPKRDNLLLSRTDCTVYHLDDYTRFNTVEDIIRELVPNARIRREGKKKHILIYAYNEEALVMLDGVPVSDHDRILSFDALSLGDVYVYPQKYVMGNTVFSGIINFVTTRHDMSSLIFDDHVRIMDFRGCSYPLALNSAALQPMKPAGRTLVWHPMTEIPAGGDVRFDMPASQAPLIVRVSSLK